MAEKYDVLILGGGIVGLSIAKQLLEKRPNLSIAIIDKENRLAQHNSGRNSGVLHAGIYYKPETLKAKVCVKGARRLKKWILDNKLPINACGKVVLPTVETQDPQLDVLLNRGIQNGAVVDLIDEDELHKLAPLARTASGRALYSPETCVTNPQLVMQHLANKLGDNGLAFYLSSKAYSIDKRRQSITFANGLVLSYGYLVNTTGIHALDIAKQFDLGGRYKVIPFKGNYWALKKPSNFNITTNLYPVPDLNVPFLGVHFTPSANNDQVYVGPTATPALGRENYKSLEKIELSTMFYTLFTLSRQYATNTGNMRKYVKEQSLMWSKYIAIENIKRLVPSIKLSDIKASNKVGIRPQLYDCIQNKLEDDLVCISSDSSVHVLNAISPAFTASFELADHIISTSPLSFL